MIVEGLKMGLILRRGFCEIVKLVKLKPLGGEIFGVLEIRVKEREETGIFENFLSGSGQKLSRVWGDWKTTGASSNHLGQELTSSRRPILAQPSHVIWASPCWALHSNTKAKS